MSVYEGPIPELPFVSVDNFELPRNSYSTCFFLSHCHTDHMNGLYKGEIVQHLKDHPKCRIFCSTISRLILTTAYAPLQEVKDRIIELRMGLSTIQVPSFEDDGLPYSLTVTTIPAAHSPGSIMFLFETPQKRVLYTGDFRLNKGQASKIREFHSGTKIKKFDIIYLDATFLHSKFMEFANRNDATRLIIDKARKWLDSDLEKQVVLKMPANYGGEHVIKSVSRELKCKVHVPHTLYHIYQHVPEILDHFTGDCQTTRIHVALRSAGPCIDPNPKVLTLSPVARSFEYNGISDMKCCHNGLNTTKVNYSSHCSYSELMDFLKYIQPASVHICTKVFNSTREEAQKFVDDLVIQWNDKKTLDLGSPVSKRVKLNEPYVSRKLLVVRKSCLVTDDDLDT